MTQCPPVGAEQPLWVLTMSFQILASPGFANWMRSVKTSLAFSTYQLGKLFLIGTRDGVRLSVFERTFDRCMGLWSDSQTLWLASAFQLWRLENVLADGVWTSDGYDRLFVPMAAHTTGDIDVHDIALDHQGQLVFINTLFSCLARISSRWSFEPIWQPPFIGRVAAEDRCHLNGLAMETSQPAYVTACSQTDTAKGWRDVRRDGGCLVDVRRNEVVVERLSLPHSPRLHAGQLWLLDSGRGFFGRADMSRGVFEPLVFCPGYARAGVHRSVCHRGPVETATRTDLQWPGTRRGIRSATISAAVWAARDRLRT